MVELWDMKGLAVIAALLGNSDNVYTKSSLPSPSMVFSPDGRTLAIGSEGGTIRLWRVPLGKHLLSLEGHSLPIVAMRFAPDGRSLASCTSASSVDQKSEVFVWPNIRP
jgi:WD40 repeat protein